MDRRASRQGSENRKRKVKEALGVTRGEPERDGAVVGAEIQSETLIPEAELCRTVAGHCR